MNKCKKCEVEIDDHRFHLGFTECVDCSETEKYSAHTVFPHKTGGYVQPVKSDTKKHLQNTDTKKLFITGYARSGTTILLNNLYSSVLVSNLNSVELSNFTSGKVLVVS